MENEDRKIFQHISDTLDEVLVVMKKPDDKFMRFLQIGSAIAGVLAIIGVADVIRNWFIGG